MKPWAIQYICPSSQKKYICLSPISLCNVIYKIIAKSLALKIQPHLPACILDPQFSFVKGRRILEKSLFPMRLFILSIERNGIMKLSCSN